MARQNTPVSAALAGPPARPVLPVRRRSLGARLRAWFDRMMDRGTPALIGLLAGASLILIVLASVLVKVLSPGEGPWPHVLWTSFLTTIDPGALSGEGGPHLFKLVMLLATIGGIFVVSSLIGVLTTGMSNRLAMLRQGRSEVIASRHAVILGWSDQVYTVVGELAKANSKRSVVVILADEDKVEMDERIRARVPDLGRTQVVCRRGSPLKPQDLELVSLDTARSVMVMSPDAAGSDIHVIKALLLLGNREWRGTHRPHIVAAVQEHANVAVADMAGGDHAQVVDANDIAVRLVVQSHRQSGLSTVCTDLLDFSGNEIYLARPGSAQGHEFGSVLTMLERGCPIGILHDDDTFATNPPMRTVIGATDRLIVIAETQADADLVGLASTVDDSAVVLAPDVRQQPDRTLLINWNQRAPRIIELLDELVEPGSIVDIAARTEPPFPLGARERLSVGYQECDPIDRASLEALGLESYRHIVVLSDESVDPGHADDRTLVTLLHLRDHEKKSKGDPYSIVTEMNDDANREVAQVAAADDFIVSKRLITLLMTQLAQNRHLERIILDLFDPSGSEIHLKPASHYVRSDVEVSFATVVASAARRGETAIGYRVYAEKDQLPSYGVRLNPAKSSRLTLAPDDSVIVVAVT